MKQSTNTQRQHLVYNSNNSNNNKPLFSDIKQRTQQQQQQQHVRTSNNNNSKHNKTCAHEQTQRTQMQNKQTRSQNQEKEAHKHKERRQTQTNKPKHACMAQQLLLSAANTGRCREHQRRFELTGVTSAGRVDSEWATLARVSGYCRVFVLLRTAVLSGTAEILTSIRINK
ncbi:unnamed protein product [Polarella glacialis]|uniref:Uncharacterized protein n=1 Tax=Polarella glacialis TaxID=89957 RepID=A0A813IHS1_POLGL|nr:unnamed protein product [Polarella glacialis]